MSAGDQYRAWIAAWLEEHDPAAACMAATEAMSLAFRELLAVKGFALLPISGPGEDGRRAHAWCVDPAGRIWDPTASQWAWTIDYEEAPSDAYGTSRCIECGCRYFLTTQWHDHNACSRLCCERMARECGRP